VLTVLLASGADPGCATKPGVETEGFMRDCRTKGETPLHRAAAFGELATIAMLINAGAMTRSCRRTDVRFTFQAIGEPQTRATRVGSKSTLLLVNVRRS